MFLRFQLSSLANKRMPKITRVNALWRLIFSVWYSNLENSCNSKITIKMGGINTSQEKSDENILYLARWEKERKKKLWMNSRNNGTERMHHGWDVTECTFVLVTMVFYSGQYRALESYNFFFLLLHNKYVTLWRVYYNRI